MPCCTSLGHKILSPLINIASCTFSPVSASCAHGIHSKLVKYIAFAVWYVGLPYSEYHTEIYPAHVPTSSWMVRTTILWMALCSMRPCICTTVFEHGFGLNWLVVESFAHKQEQWLSDVIYLSQYGALHWHVTNIEICTWWMRQDAARWTWLDHFKVRSMVPRICAARTSH